MATKKNQTEQRPILEAGYRKKAGATPDPSTLPAVAPYTPDARAFRAPEMGGKNESLAGVVPGGGGTGTTGTTAGSSTNAGGTAPAGGTT